MLFRAILDRALARGRKSVVGLKAGTHARKGFGLHGFPILHVTVGFVADQSIIRCQVRTFSVDHFLF